MVKDLGIRDKVLFAGYLGGKDKFEALVDADVAVFPSRAEQGLPFAALEAIMCGTDIIVTEGTGATEDVRKLAPLPIVVEFNDIDKLSYRIGQVLDGMGEIEWWIGQAQAYIKKNLSMAEKVKDYEKLYERCVE